MTTRRRVPQARMDEQFRQLSTFACGKLVEIIKEDARRVGSRMLTKFDSIFEEENGVPRVWTPSADVKAVAVQARFAAARVLAQLSVIPAGMSDAGAPEASIAQVQVNFLSSIPCPVLQLNALPRELSYVLETVIEELLSTYARGAITQ